MRADASHDFGPDNSILVVRIQFWAIEIARNREGYNDKIRYKYKPEPTAANTTTANTTAQEEADGEKQWYNDSKGNINIQQFFTA